MNRSKNFSAIILLSFLFLSCSTTTKKDQSQTLFPDGKYTQSIQLVINPGSPEQKHIPMASFSEIKGEEFKMLTLTPFGTKAFEAQGNLQAPEEVQLTFHMTLPKFLNPQFVKETLVKIHQLKKISRRDLKKEMHREWIENGDILLEIYSFTREGIPASFKVTHPKWQAFVATSKYEN